MTKLYIDTACDIEREYLEENDIGLFVLSVSEGGNVYREDENPLDPMEMYQGMVDGKVYTTSQVNLTDLIEVFTEYAKNDQEIIYLTIGSALSGTYETAVLARQNVMEDYPEAKIEVVDSLSATTAYTALIKKAVKMKNNGLSQMDIVNLLNDLKTKQEIFFVVGDLEYLYRGGRLNKATKNIAGLFNARPILTLDEKGALKMVDVSRGEKGMVKKLLNLISKETENGEILKDQNIYISSGRWEGAKELIKNDLGEKIGSSENIIEGQVGPVIGAHTGPEVVTVTVDTDISEYSIYE